MLRASISILACDGQPASVSATGQSPIMASMASLISSPRASAAATACASRCASSRSRRDAAPAMTRRALLVACQSPRWPASDRPALRAPRRDPWAAQSRSLASVTAFHLFEDFFSADAARCAGLDLAAPRPCRPIIRDIFRHDRRQDGSRARRLPAGAGHSIGEAVNGQPQAGDRRAGAARCQSGARADAPSWSRCTKMLKPPAERESGGKPPDLQ
jgi:hypothetical protein